jgi:hypothetical protein
MSPIQNNTDTRSGRYYTYKKEKFWSVTTLIGGGLPKPALIGWAAKFTAQYAIDNIAELNTMLDAGDQLAALDWLKGSRLRSTEAKANLGSDVHAAAEAFVLGGQYEPSPAAAPYIEGFHQWIADYSPRFEMVESTVYSRWGEYAGTLDAIVEVDGKLLVVDYKTGKGVYPEVALQLAAYRHAEFTVVGDEEVPLPKVEGGAVLHLTPKGYRWIEVRCDEPIHDAFLHVADTARYVNEVADTVLGKPARHVEEVPA